MKLVRVRAKSGFGVDHEPAPGTILKKRKCANQERCSHKWTLRYWADGRQREASFADELDSQGRPRYGSGKRLAQDAQLKIAHDKRARVFIDPKLGSARFRDECEKWITRHAGTELTKEAYQGILRAHVGPVLGDRTIAAVAQSRDDVIDLLTIRLGEGSNSRRKIARALITGVLDEAVRAGRLPCTGAAILPCQTMAVTGITMISCSLRMRSFSCSPTAARNRK